MNSEEAQYAPRDKVNYYYTQRGGYGFHLKAAAIVLRTLPKTVEIGIMRRAPGHDWVPIRMRVSRSKLKPRTEAVPSVDKYAWNLESDR